jgi:hypothetical protein
MVHDAADVPVGPASLDSVGVVFDEQRLISDAGLLLAATLSDRLGIEELVNESVWLGYRVPGAALPGRKVLSLVHGMLAGADSIDDMNVLRAGSAGLILGHRVMAPSTLGTFLRAFTFGHVRQLDHVFDQSLARVWEAGAGARFPRPRKRADKDMVELSDMPERERAQERPERRGRHHPVPQDQACRPRAEHVHVIDRVRAGEHPVHQREHLAARQRRARRLGSSHTLSFTSCSTPNRSASDPVNSRPASLTNRCSSKRTAI